MRKTFYILALSLLIAVLLSACGQVTYSTVATPAASAAAVTPKVSVSPSASNSTSGKTSAASSSPSTPGASAPSASAKVTASPPAADNDSSNKDKLTFDAATSRFFGGDVNAALNKMRPLIDAAAATEHALQVDLFYSGDLQNDGGFAWNMIYRFINIYCAHDKNIKAQDSKLIVPVDVMKGYFKTVFTGFQGTLPDVPSDLASFVKVDKNTGAYTLTAASGDEYDYTLKGITLSKASSAADPTMSATLTIEVSTPADGKAIGSVEIEVTQNAASAYQFSVQSVSPVN